MTASTRTGDDEPLDRIFRVLASRQRRQILGLLAADEAGSGSCCGQHDACGCTIAERLGLSPATVSYHMKALTEASLVTAHKRGLWVYYRVAPRAFEKLVAEILSWVPPPSASRNAG